MNLLPDELRRALPPIHATESVPLAAKWIVAKFFDPCSRWTWYAVEGQPTEDGDFEFWGLVRGHCEEWGYFLLSDLQSFRGRLGIGIERDLFFEPGTLLSHAEREALHPDLDAEAEGTGE